MKNPYCFPADKAIGIAKSSEYMRYVKDTVAGMTVCVAGKHCVDEDVLFTQQIHRFAYTRR